MKHRIASTDHEGDLSEETFQNIISAIENDIKFPKNNGMIELILCVSNSEIIIIIGVFYIIEQDETESESMYACNQIFV